MARKKTKEDFIKELNEVYHNEFEVTGEFSGMKKKVLIKHVPCGLSYDRYPYDLVKKRYAKCKHCYQSERIVDSIDTYLKENNLEDTYRYDIGDAKFQYDKIIFHCNNCDNDFLKNIDTFKQGQHCPYCAGQRTNKKYAQYKIDCITSKGEFVVLNDDIDAHDSPLEVLHTDCNRVTKTSLSYFVVQNPVCHHCNKEFWRDVKMKTTEQFEEEMVEMYGSQYTLLSEYNGAHEKIELLHNYCNNIIEVKPNHVLSYNFGCKYCNMSMPEGIIYNVLLENDISFEFQYKFDDCVGETGVKLPFDFAIFYNGKLKFIIEYDGQQHFRDAFGNSESFERVVRNDKIKNKYCKENEVKLFRISYKELKDLKNIVKDILAIELPNKVL